MSTSIQVPARADACDAAHFVRFYQEDTILLDEVAEFLDSGLRGGGTGIVIATEDHLRVLRQQLMGFGSMQAQRKWFPGELIMLDADDALAQFMVGDWPDEHRFDEVIGGLVRKTCKSGSPVHAFGEMVALLCARGLYDAAVRLEQLWNGLRARSNFSLFCAYPWDAFPTDELASAFRQICSEHDHVCPHDHEVTDAQKDVYLQMAILEQKNFALGREVARAREAEQTLRYRERELADFVENAAEGLHRVGPDGIILWANKAELALLGYRWEEYIGHHIAEFHADDAVIKDILQLLQSGETIYDYPARLRCKDGSVKHVVINSNACIEDGRVRYTRCFTRDAAERNLLAQAHREREALVAELSHANRAKDEFLAMLSHELRNPLAPVNAAAQLLTVAANDPERVKNAAAVITRQVAHMTGLIDDLLDVARVTRGLIVLDKAPLDLRDIVHAAAEQAAPQIQARRQHLVLDVPSEAAVIGGDRKRIIQVVANIINNATKFTPDGGRISVGLDVAPDDVELTIADNGIGMEAELVTRVFDLFIQGRRTPDRAQGGLGIGLAVAKSLVESHGGSISVRSDGPGKGSIFTVRLSRLRSDIGNFAKPPGHLMPQAIARSLRIVVVDDNRDAADALATLLTAMGHDARAVYTSQAALQTAATDCPDVFLLDIGLPEIDGIALARQLMETPEAAGTVLIAITGYGQEGDKASTKAAGFQYHLVKPVDTSDLLDILASIGSRTANESVGHAWT